MVQRFKENWSTLCSKASVPWVVGSWRRGVRNTIHFNGDSTKHRTFVSEIILSANQLRMYGAVANWCQQFGLDRGKNWGRTQFVLWDKKMLDGVYPLEEVQLLVSPSDNRILVNRMREKHFELRNTVPVEKSGPHSDVPIESQKRTELHHAKPMG